MLAKFSIMCIIISKGFASIFFVRRCEWIDNTNIEIIEYLGVRYYVIGDVGEDWLCINGYSFSVCIFPKSKLSKLIGKSEIDFGKSFGVDL